jgi:DNA-binding transcriptional ArsR family regulator
LQRPTVSEHLQVLRKAKLVRDECHGREWHYEIKAKRLAEIYDWLKLFERFWHKKMKLLNDVLNEEYP